MNEPINKWSQEILVQWVSTLNSIKKDDDKQKIINGIYAFDASGGDVFDADLSDLAECLEINKMVARKLFDAIQAKRGQEFKYNQPGLTLSEMLEGDDSTFSVNLSGVKAKYCRIDKLKPSDTVEYLKKQYLEFYGRDINNKDKFNELKIRRINTILENDRTLKSYGIIDDTITLTVTFRVNGGAQQLIKNEEEYGNDDKYRIRKLRYKQHKQIILSNEPDCIMGYTNKDGIKRAKMPCGCSYAADTMYRFLKSLFDQESNFRAIKIECPMPKNQCKGTTKQRKWDWSIIFIVADLSENEKIKYNKIILNRIGDGIKSCPHCEINCERPKDLRIFRVRCKQCNKPDWCWECKGPWKGTAKTSTVCGNANCIGVRLNKILKNSNMITPDWNSKIKVPEIRHCPKCFTIIEYVANCLHMKCSGCPYEFCFQCCGPWKGDYSCKIVAPKQEIK